MGYASLLTFGEARTGLHEIYRGYDFIDEVSADVAAANTASGLDEFKEGELITLTGDGKIAAKISSTATDNKMVYPNVTGHERSDYKGSMTTTYVLGNGYHARTDKFIGTPASGAKLSAKLDVDGVGKYFVAASGDPVFAICLSGVLAHQDDAEAAIGFAPTNVICVEVVSPGQVA